MKNFIKKLLGASLLVISFACGGQIDSADEADIKAPVSYDPFTSYATVQAHAAKYCTNPRAIVLNGTQTSDKQGYDWSWTMQCNGSVYVIVSAGPTSVRVTSHGLRTWLMGVSSFDPAKVNVSAIDLLSLLKKQGYARPDAMALTEPLTLSSGPHWSATVAQKTVLVDAQTGEFK